MLHENKRMEPPAEMALAVKKFNCLYIFTSHDYYLPSCDTFGKLQWLTEFHFNLFVRQALESGICELYII